MSKPSLVGKTFTRLYVESQAPTPSSGHREYLCACSCGKPKIARGTHLVSGAVKSCGCLAVELCRSVGKANKTHGREGEGRLNRGVPVVMALEK